MLGCFNPTLVQIWTNPNAGLKMYSKIVTQWLGLSIFDPKLGKTTQQFLECGEKHLNIFIGTAQMMIF